MLLTIIEFAFVTLGVKFLLGGYVIYMLLPADNVCVACDGETVAIQAPAGTRFLARALGLHHRWCLDCATSVLARRQKEVPAIPASSTERMAGKRGA